MLDAAPVDVDVDVDKDCLVDASLCTSAITMCVTLSAPPPPVVPALCVLCMKKKCFVYITTEMKTGLSIYTSLHLCYIKID